MTIGIDARLYAQAGIGRYTRELIQHLELIDTKNNYVIFLYKDSFDLYQPQNPHFKKVLVKSRWYTLSEQIFFPLVLYRYRLDLVHFLHFSIPILYNRPFVVTIHDLLLLKFPTTHASTRHPLFFWIKYLGYKFVIRVAIMSAKQIITVSYYSKNEILKNFNINSNKVVVIHEGVSNKLLAANTDRTDRDKVLAQYNIQKPYFLYIGSAYPHKNLEVLLEAFKKLLDNGYNASLVCVGNIDYFYKILYDKVKVLHLTQMVKLTGFVNDNDLKVIYSNAHAYITTSLYEGFGLPALEAMVNNTPVLVSDIEPFREILHNNALFFECENISSIVLAMQQILENEDLRNDLINKGKLLVREYSFSEMAQKTMSVYNAICITRV